MGTIDTLEGLADDLAALAATRLDTDQVPGLAMGLGQGGQRTTRGVGRTEVTGGLPVGSDTMFQVGSVSKLFTATLMLELVASGLIDLDEPLVGRLPQLQMRDRSVRDAVTVRHLMTHRAGFDGDYDLDTGRGDDALVRLLPVVARAEQHLGLGDAFSYCNLGWALAGLVAASAAEGPFEAVMRDRVLGPLGLTRTVYFPEDVVFEEHAVGHVSGIDGPRAAPWGRPRCRAPNGGVISDVDDLVSFASHHASLAAEPGGEVYGSSLDAGDMADAIGLGFMVDHVGGAELVGHGGATPGFRSWVGFERSSGAVVAIVANSDAASGLVSDLLAAWFEGVTGPPPPPVSGEPPDPAAAARFAGRWATASPATYTSSGAEVLIDPDPEHGLVLSERTGAWPDRRRSPVSVLGPERIAVAGHRLRRAVADLVPDPSGGVFLRWNGRLYRRRPEDPSP